MTKQKQQQLSKYMTIGLTDSNECAVQITEDMDATTAFQLLGTLALHILKSYEAVAHQALAAQFNLDSSSESSSDSSSDSSSESSSESKSKELELAKQGMTESLFDAMDNIFSNVLDNFYPTNPKASIEDEAILELTNKIIEERYNALTPEEREAFSKGYRTVQASITEHLLADTTEDSDTTLTIAEEPSDVDANA